MTKLNQIVAIVKTTKEDVNKRTAPLFHNLRVASLFSGLTQHYRPAEEGGTTLPDDNTEVQLTVQDVLEAFRKPMTRLFDVISTAENTNTGAFGDVVIDGETILEHVPVTFLMQLEKFLEREVRNLIVTLPVLDPAETWSPTASGRTGVYESNTFETFRTRKVQKPIVLYPATDKHAAQTQLITEDIIDGYWNKKKFSGAIPAARKEELLERIENLVVAVKKAREQANDIDVTDKPVGDKIFGYLLA